MDPIHVKPLTPRGYRVTVRSVTVRSVTSHTRHCRIHHLIIGMEGMFQSDLSDEDSRDVRYIARGLSVIIARDGPHHPVADPQPHATLPLDVVLLHVVHLHVVHLHVEDPRIEVRVLYGGKVRSRGEATAV